MGKKKDRKKAKALRDLDQLVENDPDEGWQTGPIEHDMKSDGEEDNTKANLIAENPFGALTMDDEELKAFRAKQTAKPTGHKLGVQLTGKRGNRTINQARKKKKLLEKALSFHERNESKSTKILNRKKSKLSLKQLY